MRKLIGATTIVGMVAVLAACSTSGGAADENTITVWGWRTDQPWSDLIESYSADGITVDYTGYKAEEYNQILQSALASGSGPDVMMLRSYGGLDTLVSGGGVESLDESFGGFANIPTNLVDGARSKADGKIYGVPFQSVTADVIYNKTMLDELGLEEPATWDEFIALNEDLLDQGITPMAAGASDPWVLPIYRDLFAAASYGGPDFATELLDGSSTFEDDRYTAANQVLSDMTKYFPKGFEGIKYADANALFASGSSPLYPGGIWELTNFRQAMPDVELGLFTVPPVEGDVSYAMGYLDGAIGMSSKLEGAKAEAASAYLEWVGSAEFGQKVADDLLAIPAVQGVTPDDPLLDEAAKAFAENPTPYLTYVNFDFGTPPGTSLEYSALQEMVIGQRTPDEVGTYVQDGVAQWFTPTP